MQTSSYGYTMVEKDVACCPLAIDGKWEVIGLSGNEAIFDDGTGREIKVEIPFYDGGTVDRALMTVFTNAGEPVSFYQMFPNQMGKLFCQVSIAKDDGYWLPSASSPTVLPTEKGCGVRNELGPRVPEREIMRSRRNE